MESGSGATFAVPANFTCLRRGVGGFCRFASQRTGYLRDNPEGSDLWDPARKRDDAEETAHRRIRLSTLAVLNRQTRSMVIVNSSRLKRAARRNDLWICFPRN